MIIYLALSSFDIFERYHCYGASPISITHCRNLISVMYLQFFSPVLQLLIAFINIIISEFTHVMLKVCVKLAALSAELHYPGKIHISVGVVVGGRQHTSGTSWITPSWQ